MPAAHPSRQDHFANNPLSNLSFASEPFLDTNLQTL